MGLLVHDFPMEFLQVAEKVYLWHLDKDPLTRDAYDDYRKRKLYEDTLHNLSFLDTACELEDVKIFKDYAVWLYRLLAKLMEDIPPGQLKEQMVTHYEFLSEAIKDTLGEERHKRFRPYLEAAIRATEEETDHRRESTLAQGKHAEIRKKYLDHLLAADTEGALAYVKSLAAMALPLEEVYVDIFQEVMREIGERWHANEISVEEEHYMTSLTQTALAEFHPHIFDTERNGKKVIVCTVGSELHELGARMVSDLLEHMGYDSLYLGAAVPKDSVLRSVERHKPYFLALSVTMPQYLKECRNIVESVKESHPDVMIAVGGRAFTMTDDVWKKWPVDAYEPDGKGLIGWVKRQEGETR